ncbi:hypothetical protein KRR40_38090 [Niabella defluvii]|nr:hypothetical protein KRR40_38090 [Niabella sp. I65]
MKTLLVLGIAMCGSAELSAQSKENAATKIITGQYGFENEQEYEGWKAQNSSLSFSMPTISKDNVHFAGAGKRSIAGNHRP